MEKWMNALIENFDNNSFKSDLLSLKFTWSGILWICFKVNYYILIINEKNEKREKKDFWK